MCLDVQMITQLCEKQDLEDRKMIGVFGQDPLSNEQSTFKVDRNCLSCSGNPSKTLHQLKIACLSYTSAPITHNERQYTQS